MIFGFKKSYSESISESRLQTLSERREIAKKTSENSFSNNFFPQTQARQDLREKLFVCRRVF